MTLYTWDYVRIKMGKGHINPSLVQLGFLAEVKQVDKWGKVSIHYEPTPAGNQWKEKIEAQWEQECAEIDFWNVQIQKVGMVYVGMPTGEHPSQDWVLIGLRKIFGTCYWCVPRDEEDCPGLARKLSNFRPWTQVQPWLDMRSDDPYYRGAYMRAYGEPLDMGLGIGECTGQDCTFLFPGKEELVRALCRLEEF